MKTIVNTCYALLSTLFFLSVTGTVSAQCPSGSIGVTGAGCGCMTSCNLTSLGGPNCGGGTTGNCDAGQVAMSLNIPVPAGCTYTVTATMANRAGTCSASGGDAGDQMKVDVPGGGKAFQSGTGNATLNDSYVLVGPGTIRISGTANRRDEIISYSTTSGGASCVNCSISLPVELLRFDAATSGESVECTWETGSEIHTDYFTIERSSDGIVFEPIGMLKASGTSTGAHTYKLYDSSPLLYGTTYYRLRQTDLDGTTVLSDLRSVRFGEPVVNIFPNPSEGQLTIVGKYLETKDILFLDAHGEAVQLTAVESGDERVYQLSGLSEGLYLLLYPVNGEMHTEKIVVVNR
jgi:hypothetical protein